MSNVETNANSANANNATAETKDELTKLQERFAKRSKIVIDPEDAEEAALYDKLILSVGELKRWDEKAPEGFDTMALVRTKPKKDDDAAFTPENRVIAIPSKELVFANENAKSKLYRMFRNLFMSRATNPEAQEAEFITVDGIFKASYDEEAFDALAPILLKLFRAKKQPINKSILRDSLANATFAKGALPTVKPEHWKNMLRILKEQAAVRGLDTTLFEHWENTRDAFTVGAEAIEFDFAKDWAEAETEIAERAAKKEENKETA